MIQAKAAEVYAQQQVTRLEQLVGKKITPRSALEKAQAERIRANADVRAVNAKLKILGVTDQQIEALQKGEDRPLLIIRSPMTGTIDEDLIDPGQAVHGYEKMFSVINLDEVLVEGYASPEDAALIRQGDPAFISLRDFPDREIQASVYTVNPSVDESSKSVAVNIEVSTEDGWPLPGQSVQVRLMVAPPYPVLTVPLPAVQFEGDKATVFVRRDANTFEKRNIEISRVNEQQIIVRSGLAEGEEVAITQVFSLKALGRFDQYGEE